MNWLRSVSSLLKPLADEGVHFDIATMEGVGGVAKLIDQISPAQIVFGLNAPLFYLESVGLKLVESTPAHPQEHALRRDNAQRLLTVKTRVR